jgi:hypothetical protein
MVSGLVVLLELRAGFALGIDVENNAVRVLNGKTTIPPRMVFERHDSDQTGNRESLEFGINVGDAEVVSQTGWIAGRLIVLGCHELKSCTLSEFEKVTFAPKCRT